MKVITFIRSLFLSFFKTDKEETMSFHDEAYQAYYEKTGKGYDFYLYEKYEGNSNEVASGNYLQHGNDVYELPESFTMDDFYNLPWESIEPEEINH